MIIKKLIAIAIIFNLFSCSAVFIKGDCNNVRIKIDNKQKLDSLVNVKVNKMPPKQWKKKP